MSIGSFDISLSGLNSVNQTIANIAGNIANSLTPGYSRVDTQLTPQQGGGVSARPIYTTGQSSSIYSTDDPNNLAISGNGLFIVGDTANQNGGYAYTRAGDFSPDANGYLRNGSGYYLYGQPVNAQGVTSGNLQAVQVSPGQGLAPQATSSAGLTANFGATSSYVSDAAISAASGGATSITSSNGSVSGPIQLSFTDALGSQHDLTAYATKLDPAGAIAGSFGTAGNGNKYLLSVSASSNVAGAQFSVNGAGTQDIGVEFNSSGSLVGVYQASALVYGATAGSVSFAASSGTSVNLNVTDTGTYQNGQSQSINLSLNGSTFYAGTGVNVSSTVANGNPSGTLQNTTIDANGYVVGHYDNGQSQKLYQVPLANFSSTSNLQAARGNAYSPSAFSGSPQIGSSGQNGFGQIVSGSLEGNNVSLEDEMTQLLYAQNVYKANINVIKAENKNFDALLDIFK